MLANEYCIIIPIYNGRKHLSALVSLVKEHENLKKQAFFIIDDYSQEEYTKELSQLKQLNHHIRYHKNKQNIGLHRSIAQAINLSDEGVLVTLDQDYISILPRLLENLDKIQVEEGGISYLKVEKKERKFLRSFASSLTLSIIRLFGNIKLEGLYSIRILEKKGLQLIPLQKHLIVDLFLFKHGFKANYVESEIAIEDKKGNTSIFALGVIFLNITLFYTIFFEFIALGAIALNLFSHQAVFLSFILPLLLLLGYKWLNLFRNE